MRKHRERHHLPISSIYHVKLFPYLTLFVIGLQLICLTILFLSPDLRITFYVGLPFMILPILIYKYTKHRRPIL
jgi:AAT family amino acid transporter